MCTNAPLGRAWLQPGRRVCTSRCRRPPGAQPLSPPPSRREGDRLALGGAADGGLLRRNPPLQAACSPPLPEMCQARWSGSGLISGVWLEGPSTLVQAGPGQPPRVPKLAPGGRRAQWEWELKTRSGSRGPGPRGRGTVQGSRTHPPRGRVPGALPSQAPACRPPHPPPATPERAWGEGHTRLGVSRERGLASFQDPEPDLRPRLPKEAWPHPSGLGTDATASAGKPHFQGLSGDRAGPQEP